MSMVLVALVIAAGAGNDAAARVQGQPAELRAQLALNFAANLAHFRQHTR